MINKKTLYFSLKIILLVIWMVIIFSFSNETAEVSSIRSDGIVNIFTSVASIGLSEDMLTFIIRKLAHFTIYFILGILMCNVLLSKVTEEKKIIIFSAISCCLYAISDELHQTFLSGRSAETRDVAIDTFAAIVGVIVFIRLSRMAKRTKQKIKEVAV